MTGSKMHIANMRSITSLLFKFSRDRSTLPETKKSPLDTLSSPLLEQVFSYLSTTELIRLSNSCITLKEKISPLLTARRQQSLKRSRVIQSTIPAANLPTELLHEIFRYLGPKDFYIATKVCTSWRYAGEYPQLIKNKISTLRQYKIFEGATDVHHYDLQTLISHLHTAKELEERIPPKHLVSTIQLEQPDSRIPPEIHLSETGHYFLSAEKAPPYQVHIYCTYRPVLANDSRPKGLTKKASPGLENAPSGLWQPGSHPLGFHEWDSTPTYIMTLPCKGKVISASFSPPIHGSVYYDTSTNSYSKGVDVLVLFEGGSASLFKVRPTPTDRSDEVDTSQNIQLLRRCLLKLGTSEHARWYIWDSMEFLGIVSGFPNEKPILAKLDGTGGRAIFATEKHLEVWKGLSNYNSRDATAEGLYKGMCWDKGAAVRELYSLPDLGTSRNLERIFVGNPWYNGLGSHSDVYIICTPSRPLPGAEEQLMNGSSAATCTEETLIFRLELHPKEPNRESLETPRFPTLPYRVLSTCEDYNNTSLYFGLDHTGHALTFLRLYSLNYKEKPYQSCLLTPELNYPYEHSLPMHTTSFNLKWHSTHPIIATATAEGNIYISFPPSCNPNKRACKLQTGSTSKEEPKCACPPARFKKLARIPPDTGGRITDMKISYRCPVLDSPRRNILYLKDLQVMKGEKGILVLLISTDKGRLEVCYFGDERKEIDAKRSWTLKGSEIRYN